MQLKAEANKGTNPGRIKKILFLSSLILLLILMVLIATATGTASVSWKSLLAVFLNHIEAGDTSADILFYIRLPRVILAAVVGASLSIAGAVFQGLFRNPMADPYVLGVSSGAAIGAIIAMLAGGGLYIAGFSTVPFFAFAGGILSIALVYNLAKVGKAVPVMTLLLAGIAVSAFLSAVVSLLTYFSGDQLHQVVFWMMGGLGGASWPQVLAMLPYILVGFIIIYCQARELNILLLGEETARQLGVETERVKKILMVGASLLVAAAVSTSGIIGFVGLIVPHFIRLAAGPDHRLLLPASALLGASTLIAADTLARTIISPTELPVGIITAIVGAPVFIYLLKQRKKLRYFNSSEG